MGRRGRLQEDLPVFTERGYRIRLLSAAFRNHMHWSEFIGADAVISPPYAWQMRINASDIEVIPRIENPVAPMVIEALMTHFEDFRRAYAEAGISVDEFDHVRPDPSHAAPVLRSVR